jgi:hypothetical protein
MGVSLFYNCTLAFVLKNDLALIRVFAGIFFDLLRMERVQ